MLWYRGITTPRLIPRYHGAIRLLTFFQKLSKLDAQNPQTEVEMTSNVYERLRPSLWVNERGLRSRPPERKERLEEGQKKKRPGKSKASFQKSIHPFLIWDDHLWANFALAKLV